MGAFGAGISLAVASSLMLFVVSSVIAFNGWPDDLSGTSEPQVAALLGAAASSAPAERAVVALPRPVAPSVDQEGRSASGRSAGTASDGNDSSSSSGGGGGGGGTTAPPDTATGGSAQVPGESPDVTAKVDPIDQVAAVVGKTTDAVRDTTSAVADVVAPVAPSVSGALQSVGAAGAGTVDSAVQQLLP